MLQDMKFLSVYCGTNDANVVGLSSKMVADGKRTQYECKCKGTVRNQSAVSLYCYIHYWECPV